MVNLNRHGVVSLDRQRVVNLNRREVVNFTGTSTNGSHYRFKHEDGRVTTVPVHKNLDLPKGLLRKIIKEDLDLSQEQFDKLWKAFSKK